MAICRDADGSCAGNEGLCDLHSLDSRHALEPLKILGEKGHGARPELPALVAFNACRSRMVDLRCRHPTRIVKAWLLPSPRITGRIHPLARSGDVVIPFEVRVVILLGDLRIRRIFHHFPCAARIHHLVCRIVRLQQKAHAVANLGHWPGNAAIPRHRSKNVVPCLKIRRQVDGFETPVQ